jgi:mRNA-degrading endonuclease toxin of MazEF toxin-antitoxin module
LTSISVLLLFQLRAIDNSRLKKKVGVLEDLVVKKIKKQLGEMLEI